MMVLFRTSKTGLTKRMNLEKLTVYPFNLKETNDLAQIIARFAVSHGLEVELVVGLNEVVK